MFEKKYEERLVLWYEFRKHLETSNDPIQDTIDFFRTAPATRYAADPYDQITWPTPWELIQENKFCEFVKILAICYTLQLTDRFSREVFEIHITQDKETFEKKYLLFVNGKVVGYDIDCAILEQDLPRSIALEMRIAMPHLQ